MLSNSDLSGSGLSSKIRHSRDWNFVTRPDLRGRANHSALHKGTNVINYKKISKIYEILF